MSYNFYAEKHDAQDLRILHKRLTECSLIEFFPVDISGGSLVLGISIPFKAMDDPQLENELKETMTWLVIEQGFLVVDLFTGKAIDPGDIPGLTQRLSIP
ncbi:MAG: hypothetical protein KDA79_13490 [Planctomycetaceae bacterium]|nr:hypothetical protein [Planctomycetaceae bacterium]